MNCYRCDGDPCTCKDGITIYHGDCLEVLPGLSGVQLVVTSPPYNQNLQSFKPSGMHAETGWVDRISAAYHDTMPESEYQQWQRDVIDLCFDACTEDSSLFYNHKHRWRDANPILPTDWLRATKWKLRQEIVWARNGSVTQNARMFPPSDERIYWMRHGDKWRWNRYDTPWRMTY